MTNTIKQVDNNTIILTKEGALTRVYRKVIPGESEYTIKDLVSYIKYKGEHYA